MSMSEREIVIEIDKRNVGVQQQMASLVHTRYAIIEDLLKMSDHEIDALYNQMRAEQDS